LDFCPRGIMSLTCPIVKMKNEKGKWKGKGKGQE
jgi:hypothetical protein